MIRTHTAILDMRQAIQDVFRVHLFLEVRAEVVQNEGDQRILHHRDHDCDFFVIIDF